MSQEAYFLKPELTFGELDIQLVSSQLFQDYPQVLTMLFGASRIDKYVVNEDNDKLIQFLHEDFVHEVHEVGHWLIQVAS
jgi:hypothetical protein